MIVHPNARNTRVKLVALLAGMVFGFGVPGAAAAGRAEDFGDKLMVMGTGSPGGSFRPIGEALCEAVNAEREQSSVRCVPMGTAGTVFNLHAVINGNIQLGIAQEDLLVQLRTDVQQTQAQRLRVLALLHDSPIVVVAHRDAKIGRLADLRGKAFNLGNQGSGQATIASALLKAAGLEPEDLSKATTLPTRELAQAFCERKVDAIVEAVAHPSPLYMELRACGGEFVGLDEPLQQRLRGDNTLLSPMTVPAGTYEGQEAEVRTLGMRNVLFTRDDLDIEAASRLLRAIHRRIPQLREFDPLLRSMQLPSAAGLASVPAPAHPGALRALSAKDAP